MMDEEKKKFNFSNKLYGLLIRTNIDQILAKGNIVLIKMAQILVHEARRT